MRRQSGTRGWQLRDLVSVQGLTQQTDLNGQLGMLEKFLPDGRWSVHVLSIGKVVSVKPENLVRKPPTVGMPHRGILTPARRGLASLIAKTAVT